MWIWEDFYSMQIKNGLKGFFWNESLGNSNVRREIKPRPIENNGNAQLVQDFRGTGNCCIFCVQGNPVHTQIVGKRKPAWLRRRFKEAFWNYSDYFPLKLGTDVCHSPNKKRPSHYCLKRPVGNYAGLTGDLSSSFSEGRWKRIGPFGEKREAVLRDWPKFVA